MKHFADLLELLALTPSRTRKITALAQYFAEQPDPDRGLALAVLTGEMDISNVKPALLKETVLAEVDETLFALSYDYVGDLGETIALIWPHHGAGELPKLSEVVAILNQTSKADLPKVIGAMLTQAAIHERWALVKLATGALRIGVSARLAKTALSEMSGVDLQAIEEVWHGIKPPYGALFAWLEGKTERPDIDHTARFHPLMLANPIEDKDFDRLDPRDFAAEWKWDGIRVQLVLGRDGASLFSRGGDDIAASFPDVVEAAMGRAVLDGELLVGHDFEAKSFNDLQQRLNRRQAQGKQMAELPGFVRVYDMLFDEEEEDIRALAWTARRARLEAWFARNAQTRLDLSPVLAFQTWDDLAALRRMGAESHGHEGVMIKLRTAPYVPGRPKGFWYKWKREAKVVDAVLMYAQRGHGKRSSFYSDYTFGVWKGNEIVPIGKAYFGFTDEEMKQLDRWIRANTLASFGPVREVSKELVFEVAFDSAQKSGRHKSGVALRFPRINRIRWDKPAHEAARLEDMDAFVG